jgi:hypothetical protein
MILECRDMDTLFANVSKRLIPIGFKMLDFVFYRNDGLKVEVCTTGIMVSYGGRYLNDHDLKWVKSMCILSDVFGIISMLDALKFPERESNA